MACTSGPDSPVRGGIEGRSTVRQITLAGGIVDRAEAQTRQTVRARRGRGGRGRVGVTSSTHATRTPDTAVEHHGTVNEYCNPGVEKCAARAIPTRTSRPTLGSWIRRGASAVPTNPTSGRIACEGTAADCQLAGVPDRSSGPASTRKAFAAPSARATSAAHRGIVREAAIDEVHQSRIGESTSASASAGTAIWPSRRCCGVPGYIAVERGVGRADRAVVVEEPRTVGASAMGNRQVVEGEGHVGLDVKHAHGVPTADGDLSACGIQHRVQRVCDGAGHGDDPVAGEGDRSAAGHSRP